MKAPKILYVDLWDNEVVFSKRDAMVLVRDTKTQSPDCTEPIAKYELVEVLYPTPKKNGAKK